MVMPNYRGSTGSGEASVKFLLGKIGSTDVADSQQAAEALLKMFPDQLSQNKCLLFGGSHGGFLSLHLSAQFSVCRILYIFARCVIVLNFSNVNKCGIKKIRYRM